MRKLVTVRRVAATRPIQGADRIQIACIDGWQCVVKVNEFSEGDLGVYFEIDSFLPAADERWAFLSKGFVDWEGQIGFRVKTIKLRGQLSQGLLVPLAMFPEITSVLETLEKELGKTEAEKNIMEMTFEEALNVKKYEKPEFDLLPENASRSFYGELPPFIRKTDQMRCQNLPDLFDQWGEATFQETTKMDGSSMTVYFLRKDSNLNHTLPALEPSQPQTALQPNGRVGVASRNKDIIERQGNRFWDIAKANDLPAKLSTLDRNIALQGELCGSTIQANFEGFAKGYHDFYLFSVWDIDKQKYLAPREGEQLAREIGIKHVPVIGYFKLRDIAKNVEELVKMADGVGINGKKREGIVFKHLEGDFGFKAISNQYLLKHGE